MDALQAPAWVPAADADRWRSDVLAWTSDVLAGLGRPAIGPATIHKLAPWSIVLQVPTSDDPVWFKQNVPALGPEPVLLQPWTDLAAPAELRKAVPAALLLGVPGRSESWRRAVRRDAPGGYADASTAWLLELVDGAGGAG